ncbi:MAG TPA: VIT family protein [Steroidobacter sp.]|nr:VIT family protein [Steroidobacter sp.]
MRTVHRETHRTHRIGWLRAAVLGANDGAISTASLVVGVAAAGSAHAEILLAGVAGLASGALSMAAGEYVSVQSQVDSEKADIAKEKRELEHEPERELAELAGIYMRRGLDEGLARRVAEQLTANDALGAHTRDELGITSISHARPRQAALSSAASFAAGALIPIVTATLSPVNFVTPVVGVTTFVVLLGLGGLAAHAGGASAFKGAARVAFWGALAMATTAVIGRLVGTIV